MNSRVGTWASFAKFGECRHKSASSFLSLCWLTLTLVLVGPCTWFSLALATLQVFLPMTRGTLVDEEERVFALGSTRFKSVLK